MLQGLVTRHRLAYFIGAGGLGVWLSIDPGG